MEWFYNTLDNMFPFIAFTSAPFCNLNIGDCFQERDGVYCLLMRDAIKVKVVKVNWWTRMFWGKQFKNESIAG